MNTQIQRKFDLNVGDAITVEGNFYSNDKNWQGEQVFIIYDDHDLEPKVSPRKDADRDDEDTFYLDLLDVNWSKVPPAPAVPVKVVSAAKRKALVKTARTAAKTLDKVVKAANGAYDKAVKAAEEARDKAKKDVGEVLDEAVKAAREAGITVTKFTGDETTIEATYSAPVETL